MHQHQHQKTIERLYQAFARLDAYTMAGCYAADASFDDEVFSLRGRQQVSGMWHMLCSATQIQGREAWQLAYSGIHVDEHSGQAHWEADYRFSATGRLVHNRINSRFTFDPHGLISSQHDSFDFWAWSRQALGMPGLLLGWTPFLRHKVQAQAASKLQKYLTKHPQEVT